MKTKCHLGLRRLLGLLAAAALLIGAGCLEKRIVWSPDGRHAAIIGEDGLYLCDAAGRLSGLLAPEVYLAAWRADSQRLWLARKHAVKEWAVIAPALGGARAGVEAQAEALWSDLTAGKPWSVLTLDFKGKNDVVEICLRDRHRDALPGRLTASEWQALAEKSVNLHELVPARLDGEKLVLEAVRYTGFGAMGDIRMAPKDDAVAFSAEMPANTDETELAAFSLATADAPVVVAQRTSPFPDWSADGRSLVYVEASGGAPAKDNEALTLGVLTQRVVTGVDGRIAPGEKTYLAGMMFNRFTHVRCLHDGRVLFNAAEMSLPLAAADYGGDQREQLFALDPARQSTLVRLIPRGHEAEVPPMLAFFEVSPDDRTIVFGGMEGEVCVFTLATGAVHAVQTGAKEKYHGLPTWRANGEFTYVKRMPEKDGVKPRRPAEVVLHRDGKEVVLSEAWPDATLASVAQNYAK